MRNSNVERLLIAFGIFASVFFGKKLGLSDAYAPETKGTLFLPAVNASMFRADTAPSPSAAPQFAIVHLTPLPDRVADKKHAIVSAAGTKRSEEEFVRRTAEEGDEVSVQAAAFFVREMDSSSAPFGRNQYNRWPTASLAKLMSAVISFELVGPEKRVVTEEAPARDDGDVAFKAGEAFTVRDLVKAMLLVSSNEAAEAIARFYGRDAFIRAMQNRANELGMAETVFADPSGLSPLNQSTAADLDILVRYILEREPSLFSMSAGRSGIITELASGTTRALTSIHAFAGTPGFIGGKTGQTDAAKENLISLFERNGRRVIIIVLGAEDRFKATKEIYDFVARR